MISFAPYGTVARLLVLPILAGAAMLAVAGSCLAQARTAEDLIVNYDQSQLVKLPRPAAEIIIGNPSIADVNVQNGNLLVVTGKTFGITNMIILDAQRNIILDQRILVKRDEAKVVNLMRGTSASPTTARRSATHPSSSATRMPTSTAPRPPRRRSASPSGGRPGRTADGH